MAGEDSNQTARVLGSPEGPALRVDPLKGRRVAFVAGTLGQGGAEKQLFLIARSLRRLGTEVTVMSLSGMDSWGARLQEEGIAVEDCSFGGSKVARLHGMAKRLVRWDPSWVQSQHFFANPYAGALGRWLGVPSIGAIRNSGRHELESHSPMLRWLSLTTVDWLVANSRKGVTEISRRKSGRLRLRYLPNAVQECPLSTGGEGERVRILAAGRLVARKRFDRFVDLVAELRHSSDLEITATLLGSGPLFSDLQRRAQDRGLFPSVLQMPGSVPDIAPYLAESDVLVAASQDEGVPNVVMEAMAAGLGVVATSVGGLPELVTHAVNGLLVDPNDSNQLKESTRQLVNDAGLRRQIGLTAQAFVRERYSISRLEENLLELYREVLP